MAGVFEAKWWTVPVALAWIITRDRNFTQHCEHADDSLGVSVDLALYRQDANNPEPKIADTFEAKQLLLKSMKEGSIRTSGVFFERVGNSDGGTLRLAPDPRLLTDVELEPLHFEKESGVEVLTNEDWRISRGSDFSNHLRGYQSVKLQREDVLKAFGDGSIELEAVAPVAEAAAASRRRIPAPIEASTDERGMICAAARALWGEHLPDGLSGRRIADLLNQQRIERNSSGIPVDQWSQSTVERALGLRL